ncbi:hypothetical protein MMC30_005533 [Trapelia coarctata]|nr:hypothetical protein [Trapelia coarctata]
MDMLKAILPCLPIGTASSGASGFSDDKNDPLLSRGSSYYPVEKKQLTITIEEAANKIICALNTATKPGVSLDATIQSIVHQAGGWSQYLAERVLSALEAVLRAGTEMNAALKEAYLKAFEEAKKIEGFVEAHPVATTVFCTIIALGVLWILAPYVLGALGFGEEIVGGSWAARWMSTYRGFVPKGSVFSYLQSLGAKWGKMRKGWML